MRHSLYLKQDPPSGVLGVSSAPDKPRWVLVGLQTDKSGNQERNAAIFLLLQPDEYAGVFESFQIPYCRYGYRLCHGAVLGCIQILLLASRYYGIDNLLAGSQVNPAAYKALYPIHVFNVSKQSKQSRCKDGI